MKVRYIKRYEPNHAIPRDLVEVTVLQQQVMTHRDEDGTRHYDWEDVPTVEVT